MRMCVACADVSVACCVVVAFVFCVVAVCFCRVWAAVHLYGTYALHMCFAPDMST